MDEQPVALATMVWSPKSWLTSLTYGVSPQPEHAPENSHSGEPVQSSGASWSVYLRSLYSFQRAGTALKVGGASWARPASYTLARMTACGPPRTHLPHWMQIFSS